jgi:2-keto-4-pentenoate hydratase/2-oxohepta-3-ene-1,7-dioic acid hydratase in catechol pathway
MNKSKYFLFYWVQPFKVHTIEKQKLYTKATNYLNCKTANHYIILVLLHSYELHKNAKKKTNAHKLLFTKKNNTIIFVNEAILLPSRLVVVDSHSFASISST